MKLIIKKILFLILINLILLVLFNSQNSLALDEDSSVPDIIGEYEDATNISFRGSTSKVLEKEKNKGIDLDQIQSTMWMTLLSLGIIILIASLASLFKLPPHVLIILVLIVVFIFGMILYLVAGQDNFFAKYLIPDDPWTNITIDSFSLNTLNDMELYEEKEISNILDEYIILPDDDWNKTIVEAKTYSWQDNTNRRALVMEFTNQQDLSYFIGKYINPVRQLYVDKESVFEITSDKFTKNNYNDAFYFSEDRFLFIVLGEEKSAESAIKQIISKYPNEEVIYSNEDNTPPEIIAISPKDNMFFNKKEVIFQIKDDSNINLNSIKITDDYNFDPKTNCKTITNGYECKYTFSKLNEGINSFSITAQDKKQNENKRTIYFKKDSITPIIENLNVVDYGYLNNNILTFSAKDLESGLDLKQSTITISGIQIILEHYCDIINSDKENNKDDIKEITCNIDISSITKDGVNKLIMRIKDNAGNLNTFLRNFNKDTLPPEITFIEPNDEINFIKKKIISFSIKDEISGINKNKLFISGISGFKTFEENCFENSKNKIYCKFVSSPIEGINTLFIETEDNAQNSNSKFLNFIYDISSPTIKLTSNLITKEKTVNFELYDLVSSIDTEYNNVSGLNGFISLKENCLSFGKKLTCSIISDLNEGDNLVKITIRDKAENYANYQEDIIYDTTKPSINKFEFNKDTSLLSLEIYDKYGLNQNSISITEIQDFDNQKDCSISHEDEKKIFCNFIIKEINSNTLTVRVEDLAGNSELKTITI